MPSGEVRSVQLGDCYSAERLEDFQGDGQIMGLASYKARVLEAAAGSLGCPVSPAGHPPRVGFLPRFWHMSFSETFILSFKTLYLLSICISSFFFQKPHFWNKNLPNWNA